MEIKDIHNELLEKAAGGDMNAFEDVYRACSGFVYNVALGVTCNTHDAEEALQEAFMKVFKGLKSFKFRSSFKTWMYRVTVNTALNIRKQASSHFGRQVEYDEHIADDMNLRDDSLEKSISQNSSRELADRLLKELTPEYRSCIVLREMQGLSYEEIAKALGLNINTVRTRIKRARETLVKISQKKGVFENEMQ